MNKQQLIEALRNRDESLFRVTMIDLVKTFSPETVQRLIEEALGSVEDEEGNSKATIWMSKLSSPLTKQEAQTINNQNKQQLQSLLLNWSFVEGKDFELTPNGSILVLSTQCEADLRQAIPPCLTDKTKKLESVSGQQIHD